MPMKFNRLSMTLLATRILHSQALVHSSHFFHYLKRRTGHQPLSQLHFSNTSSDKSFVPPNPPAFTGQPIFPDVDIITPTISAQKHALARNTDSDAVFVVTGASRGIGLGLVEALRKRTKGIIIACCRSPEAASTLQTYKETTGGGAKIEILRLDLEDPVSMDTTMEQLATSYKGRIVALFNVAGILGDGKHTSGPERSLLKIERSWLEQTMTINFMAPLLLSKAVVPLMRRQKAPPLRNTSIQNPSNQNQDSSYPCMIVNISARVGSISDNNLGGWYSYRCSKAALNQATRTMAHELKRLGIYVVSLHPGTTDTDLSKPFQGNVVEGKLFPVQFTVDRLLAVAEGLEGVHTGGFYDWAGKALPF